MKFIKSDRFIFNQLLVSTGNILSYSYTACNQKGTLMKSIILATSNKGKIKELSQLLDPLQCIAMDQMNVNSTIETGISFIENALIKARHASFATSQAALADDSGLVVPALNGEPGIISARYAGVNANAEDNIQLLLKNLSSFEAEQRNAYFYCALALVRHVYDPAPLIATGIWHGRIHSVMDGNNGFGYDPIFYLDSFQCTAAQLPATIKNTHSHRAQALNMLRKQLFELNE